MSSDDGYYVSGTCGCGCDRGGMCFYHGCPGCMHTPESAKKAGLPTGHSPKCKYAPKLETETL